MNYIYHIPERNKIGVSKDLKRRMKQHRWTGLYEILEQHESDQIAGDREQELQRQYGYPVDRFHYTQSVRSSHLGGVAKKPRPNGSSPAQLEALKRARNPVEAGKHRVRVTCPHCPKEGLRGNMKRWHFDNCKLKP